MAADSCCSFVGAFLTGQVVVDGAGYRGKKKARADGMRADYYFYYKDDGEGAEKDDS